MKKTPVLVAILAVVFVSASHAQEQFSKIVGNAQIKPVQQSATLQVPYITWGGDVATFLANGGLETKADSIYAKQGLKIKLTGGDDFVAQVRDYVGGKTPFLRGTFRMLGQASEVIGSDPRIKPVVILQLSFSGGDHIVAREGLKTLNDLKRDGKKVRVACQQGGPHVGLLYDALAAAQFTRDDIEVVFVKDLTGPAGAAEAFRKDSTIDACCVITPDMIGLTGGLDSTGTGAEGTVAKAHVLVSTQSMSRSIADVYAVRSDWYQAHKPTVEKFVAGYLSAASEVVKLRDDFEKTQRMSNNYRSLLRTSQQIFGQEVLPTLEVDAHGLLLDCRFISLTGQIAFFEQRGNLSGFDPKLTAALDLATSWGYAKTRNGFDPSGLDYKKLAGLAGVEYKMPAAVIDRPGISQDDVLDDSTIVSFTIPFQQNQTTFSADRYGAEFSRALRTASTFGGAAVVIRGHANTSTTLRTLIDAGMANGTIVQSGQRGNYKYVLKTERGSEKLDVTNIDAMIELIKSKDFEDGKQSPLLTMQAALDLSMRRADAVKRAVVNYARNKGININLAQLASIGVGIAEPVISKPKSVAEAMQNMRVEISIVKVNPEALSEADFDF